MRIMLHTNAPMVPSGYGTQARLLGHQLLAAGHQVAVSAFAGLSGSPITWNGMTVLPGGQLEFGVDTVIPHARTCAADLVITLMDFWRLAPVAEQLQELNLAVWLPVDCSPLSFMDAGTLQRSGARPLAMSTFGLDQLREAGYRDAVYIPHAVDTETYQPYPEEQRQAYRAGMGLQDLFVVGMVAANNDHLRKGFPEQVEAFRRFHELHPQSILLIHTVARSGRGLDLPRMAQQMGLDPASYRFSDTYAQLAGIFDDEMMVDFYNICDVLMECSYAEAFGVPMLEAQACGTPVISTRGSAMDEMRGQGWGVNAEPFWNHAHGAWWQRPLIDSIRRALEKAHHSAARGRAPAREFALAYDTRTVFHDRWVPYLAQVEQQLAESTARDSAEHAGV